MPPPEGPSRDHSSGDYTSRERIVAAALEIAGKEGVQALTTRRVAAAAGVNLGLLHYYFDSKEALVREALGSFLGQLAAVLDGLDPGSSEPEEALAVSLARALDIATGRPGLLFSLVGAILEVAQRVDFEVFPESGSTVREARMPVDFLAGVQASLSRKVKALIAARLPGIDEERLAMRTIRLFTSIFHPLICTDFPRLVFGCDLKDQARRERYVRGAVEAAFRE
jgi:AcrR family transcriptional regulator